MIRTPMDVAEQFPVRKNGKQKQAFRDAVQSYARDLGYKTKVEKGRMGCRNILIGDPETAKYLVTAHYDTPATLWVPNLMVPCNALLFVLSQLFLTAAVLAPAVLLGFAAAWLLPDTMVWYPVLLAGLYLSLILMLLGPANPHNANDNTSGVVALLETAASMPENLRDRVCFVLFDQEEVGLLGASFHRKKHKAASNLQTVLNLDCVGDGDSIVFFPGKGVRRDEKTLERLIGLERRCGKKTIRIRDKGFAFFPSDQMQFPRGVGICALHRNRFCHWCGRIHTFRDTVLDYTNVNILRACLITFIGGAAEE